MHKLSLITSLYQLVLPIFKSYVFVFQRVKAHIDKAYHVQVDCVKKLFSYFVKYMLAICKTGSHFLKLESKEGNLLSEELIFIDSKAQKLI